MKAKKLQSNFWLPKIFDFCGIENFQHTKKSKISCVPKTQSVFKDPEKFALQISWTQEIQRISPCAKKPEVFLA